MQGSENLVIGQNKHHNKELPGIWYRLNGKAVKHNSIMYASQSLRAQPLSRELI